MPSKLRSRLTFANMVSVLALFVALGGSSYAALKVTGANVKDSSLTGRDVKNSSLTGADVKNSSLTTLDMKNRSLLAKDFKTGQLPRGAKGETGAPGHDGRDGTNGARGPGAVDLHFAHAGEPGTVPVSHQIATVGPWTVSYSCNSQPGHLFLGFSVAGPGDAQFSGVESNDVLTSGAIHSGGGAPGPVFAGQAGATKKLRYAYRVELHSGTKAATVTVTALADNQAPATPACAGNGTAVLAG